VGYGKPRFSFQTVIQHISEMVQDTTTVISGLMLSSLCRPQLHRSIPKRTPWNLGRNEGKVDKMSQENCTM